MAKRCQNITTRAVGKPSIQVVSRQNVILVWVRFKMSSGIPASNKIFRKNEDKWGGKPFSALDSIFSWKLNVLTDSWWMWLFYRVVNILNRLRRMIKHEKIKERESNEPCPCSICSNVLKRCKDSHLDLHLNDVSHPSPLEREIHRVGTAPSAVVGARGEEIPRLVTRKPLCVWFATCFV